MTLASARSRDGGSLGVVFYATYVLAELRRRSGRTILTALGPALGVGLVVTVSGALVDAKNLAGSLGTALVVVGLLDSGVAAGPRFFAGPFGRLDTSLSSLSGVS